MAALYPSAFAGLQDGTFDWTADDMRVVLMGPAFTPDFGQLFVDSLPVASIIDTSDPLENRTVSSLGVFNSDPAQFLQLFDTLAITSAILFQDVGDPAYSPLVAFYTMATFLGTPLVSEGLDQFVYPDAITGWFIFTTQTLFGEINTYVLAGGGTLPLGTVAGGDVGIASITTLGGRLTVNTQAVCATPDEPEDCSPPRIRSSII